MHSQLLQGFGGDTGSCCLPCEKLPSRAHLDGEVDLAVLQPAQLQRRLKAIGMGIIEIKAAHTVPKDLGAGQRGWRGVDF